MILGSVMTLIGGGLFGVLPFTLLIVGGILALREKEVGCTANSDFSTDQLKNSQFNSYHGLGRMANNGSEPSRARSRLHRSSLEYFDEPPAESSATE